MNQHIELQSPPQGVRVSPEFATTLEGIQRLAGGLAAAGQERQSHLRTLESINPLCLDESKIADMIGLIHDTNRAAIHLLACRCFHLGSISQLGKLAAREDVIEAAPGSDDAADGYRDHVLSAAREASQAMAQTRRDFASIVSRYTFKAESELA